MGQTKKMTWIKSNLMWRMSQIMKKIQNELSKLVNNGYKITTCSVGENESRTTTIIILTKED